MQFTTSCIIAASQFLVPALGAPVLHSHHARHVRDLVQRETAYKQYGGDGSSAQGWPTKEDWADFETIWSANERIMGISCTYHGQENDTPEEMEDIKSAIQQVAGETDIDERILLVTAMQESNGCLRVKTTANGYSNPGLMQSFQGKHNCYGINPCPKETIVGMIQDGAGVNGDVGIKQNIATAGGGDDAQTYYKAARIYNSGHLPGTGNLGLAEGATACYVSDYANRLMGWAGDKTPCTDAAAGQAGSGPSSPTTTSKPSTTSKASSTSSSKTSATSSSRPTSSGSASHPSGVAAPSGRPIPTTKPATNGDDEEEEEEDSTVVSPSTPSNSATPSSGASTGCTKWYTPKAGDYCSSTGVSMATLTKLNPSMGLDAKCSNLKAGVKYCVA
ncbi:unnamed protein product [Periconia digitata]|uniref:LysM domain-containing protein n=1 Tax=Periconia digitata TaxID=1303443 RepID=A0A9W4ULR3_9PLEO|nr:unnamed protein product [Periconia digitata]